MSVLTWMILFVSLLVIEFVAVNFLSGAIACGVLVGGILCYFGMPLWMQIAACVVISALMLLLVRPFILRPLLSDKAQANNDRIIGSDAVVICEIDNAGGYGIVNVNGAEWSARSHKANRIIPVGSVVSVINMKGDTAIVVEKE